LIHQLVNSSDGFSLFEIIVDASLSTAVKQLNGRLPSRFPKQTLRAIVSWGRYAEAFANDQEAGVFSLEDALFLVARRAQIQRTSPGEMSSNSARCRPR